MAMVSASDVINRGSLALPTSYVAPDGALETLIATTFAEVFSLDEIGADDDFFDLGGDSLIAETLSMVISERTGSSFPVSSLLEFGSPRLVAVFLSKHAQAAAAVEPDTASPPPIFIVHGRGGFTLPKPEFREALAPGQTLRMFELPGIRGGQCYERIEDIAAVYLKELNEEYPKGPVFLAAFCAGSLIALEMATQLDTIGRAPRALVLLDPPIRRDGSLGTEGKRSGRLRPQDWLRSKLRRLRALLSPRRKELLRSADFAEDELRYLRKFLCKKRQGLLKYAEYDFSMEARAKLHAAFLRYRAQPYDKPATILLSAEREAGVRHAAQIDSFLPQRQLLVVAEKHVDLATAVAARAMQAAFASALVVEAITSREPMP